MWYFLMNGIIAVWLYIDSKKRRYKAGLWYAIATALIGTIAAPAYIALRPLKRGERREGGLAWNILKNFALFWTILMFIGFLVGFSAASANIDKAGDEYEKAGAALGTAFAGVFLFFVWIVPMISALVLGAFLKKSTVVEDGPTGPLVDTEVADYGLKNLVNDAKHGSQIAVQKAKAIAEDLQAKHGSKAGLKSADTTRSSPNVTPQGVPAPKPREIGTKALEIKGLFSKSESILSSEKSDGNAESMDGPAQPINETNGSNATKFESNGLNLKTISTATFSGYGFMKSCDLIGALCGFVYALKNGNYIYNVLLGAGIGFSLEFLAKKYWGSNMRLKSTPLIPISVISIVLVFFGSTNDYQKGYDVGTNLTKSAVRASEDNSYEKVEHQKEKEQAEMLKQKNTNNRKWMSGFHDGINDGLKKYTGRGEGPNIGHSE